MIPLDLWKPSQRDLAGFFAVPFFRQVVQGTAATVVVASLVVPVDTILVLNNVQMRANATGGQTTSRMTIQVFSDVFFCNLRSSAGEALDALGNRHLNWIGADDLWIPPGTTVRAVGDFNAGVAVNNVELNVAGYLIPRGNVGLM
jgi:hypothetical protein